MKCAHSLLHWRLLLVVVLMLGSVATGGTPVIAQTGSVTSSATPSNATPNVGQQIEVSINIDMSGANAPDNKLGSFTGTLDWNPAVLTYSSDSGILAGFTGLVNTTGAATGHITFNGANAVGGAGNIIVLNITFNVAGEGNSPLNLGYSVMAATLTFTNLLPILAVMDGQVVVGMAQATPTLTQLPVTTTPTVTPAASHTPTATEAPTLTGTPVVPTPTPTPSPTLQATVTATPTRMPTTAPTVTPAPTGIPTAAPTVTPAPTPRFWTYLSLLIKKAMHLQGFLPLSGALDWKCISHAGECCRQQSAVAPRLSPRLPPFCQH